MKEKFQAMKFTVVKWSMERNDFPLFSSDQGFDGAISEHPLVFGTFIHDIFKNPLFRRTLVNYLRENKRLPPLTTPLIDVKGD